MADSPDGDEMAAGTELALTHQGQSTSDRSTHEDAGWPEGEQLTRTTSPWQSSETKMQDAEKFQKSPTWP